MSKETLEHLNFNTLIGNTDHRGHAWHYRAEMQASESNHYPGPIPVEDVRRRLFHWKAVSRNVAVEVPAKAGVMTHESAAGKPMRWDPITDRQAICRDDNNHVMGIFAPSYTMHQYDDWLVSTVANLLDDDLSISSAGLLRQGAVAWVEVSVPQSITTPEGVEFRPNLLATTSFDGSIATTFKRTVTDVVCDNTREAALAEPGHTLKVRHSRHSAAQLGPAREALAMVHTVADTFASEVARMCGTPVSDDRWEQFLEAYVPIAPPAGTPKGSRAVTLTTRKRESLERLYRHDSRVTPWAGTAHGVVQAVNTYEHHEAGVRGATRPERNMLRAVTGEWGRIDRDAYAVLYDVLS